jgi:hypothetical protein
LIILLLFCNNCIGLPPKKKGKRYAYLSFNF